MTAGWADLLSSPVERHQVHAAGPRRSATLGDAADVDITDPPTREKANLAGALTQVFERFWASDTHQRAEGGFGLGLPIARTWWRRTEDGARGERRRGSRFDLHVTLPLLHPKTRDGQTSRLPARRGRAAPNWATAACGGRRRRGRTRNPRHALAAIRRDVRTAASAHDALSMIDSFHRTSSSPRSSCRHGELRAVSKSESWSPARWPRAAIALTAEANESTKERVLAAGFAACLAKPVPWENS